MKRIISIGVILAVCAYILFFIQTEIVVLWNLNSITIQTETPLQKEKVTVEYRMNFGFYEDGSKNSKKINELLIFDGTTTKTIPNNYGENDFVISYGNEYYVRFSHFKTNWRHQHDYIFYLYKKEDELYVKVTIEGVDDMSFEMKMKLIPIKKPSKR
ncbi:MAG: hypothetical protein AB8B65_08030 [Kordia sp.]|uniref:hypothetical protein n=1 Tax=Kordia sp. TaxID=1965332 RepID=UPI00385AE1EA